MTKLESTIDPERLGVRPAEGYAGDVTPEQAAAWVASGEAVLVDVRSDAEREWVGFVPGAVAVPWKQWPGMALNPTFEAGVQEVFAVQVLPGIRYPEVLTDGVNDELLSNSFMLPDEALADVRPAAAR